MLAAPVAPVERTPLDDPFAGYVTDAAQRFGLPAAWIRVVIAAESNGDPRARSPKGAMGLMQIMPDTWADLRERYALGPDPFAPHDNIQAGAAYLREMFERYGSPGFLAAYHAGPERYEDHLATGRPLPTETRAYVAMLAPMIGNGQQIGEVVNPRDWMNAPVFVALKQVFVPLQRDDDRHEPDAPTRHDSAAAPDEKPLPLLSGGSLPGTPAASSLFVGHWSSAVRTSSTSPSVPDGSEP